jgi:hypothetical protein
MRREILERHRVFPERRVLQQQVVGREDQGAACPRRRPAGKPQQRHGGRDDEWNKK